MKVLIYSLLLSLGLLFCSSCAQEVCPANAKAVSHRQLTKINAKRKRDRGLFPNSMKHSNRKRKKKKQEEEIVEEDF